MAQTIFPLSSTERQNQIVQLLAYNQRITIDEICATFGVSKATARRDLDALDSSKKIQRVHGGALPLAYASPEIPMTVRREEQAEEKRRIGQAAAGLVHDGETIVLGSGSTVLQVALHLLNNRRNLTVITNSLPVMTLLVEKPEIALVCIGGMLLPTEFCFIGHISVLALEEVRADKAFLGVRSISLEQGLTSDYLPEAMTDRWMMRAAQETIILADHTKFGRVSPALLAPVEKVQMIVTDAETPQEFINGLQDRGVRIIVA